jgi:hypothetical protein
MFLAVESKTDMSFPPLNLWYRRTRGVKTLAALRSSYKFNKHRLMSWHHIKAKLIEGNPISTHFSASPIIYDPKSALDLSGSAVGTAGGSSSKVSAD